MLCFCLYRGGFSTAAPTGASQMYDVPWQVCNSLQHPRATAEPLSSLQHLYYFSTGVAPLRSAVLICCSHESKPLSVQRRRSGGPNVTARTSKLACSKSKTHSVTTHVTGCTFFRRGARHQSSPTSGLGVVIIFSLTK
jgi:hypothetical protein